MCLLLSSLGPYHMQTHEGPRQAASLLVSSYVISQILLVQNGLVSWCPPSGPSCSYLLSVSSSVVSPEPSREGFDGNISFGA